MALSLLAFLALLLSFLNVCIFAAAPKICKKMVELAMDAAALRLGFRKSGKSMFKLAKLEQGCMARVLMWNLAWDRWKICWAAKKRRRHQSVRVNVKDFDGRMPTVRRVAPSPAATTFASPFTAFARQSREQPGLVGHWNRIGTVRLFIKVFHPL